MPKAYLAVNDATSPWPFQANLDGWTPLHTTFPNVTVEAAALGRLNIHAKRSSQFKWYIFCVMVGGKRGLARLVSLWQLNRANQYDAIFGSAFLDAFTGKSQLYFRATCFATLHILYGVLIALFCGLCLL